MLYWSIRLNGQWSHGCLACAQISYKLKIITKKKDSLSQNTHMNNDNLVYRLISPWPDTKYNYNTSIEYNTMTEQWYYSLCTYCNIYSSECYDVSYIIIYIKNTYYCIFSHMYISLIIWVKMLFRVLLFIQISGNKCLLLNKYKCLL
jgi:hypothetical protein